jgi:glycosyltransferase involved in cell wall biosynthesis
MSAGNLLFLSPMMPDITGQGSSMRAGVALEALAREFDVYLVVAPLYRRESIAPLEEAARWPIRAMRYIPRYQAHPQLVDVREAFPGVSFDALHVYRTVMLQFALPFLASGPGRGPFRVLDMDDFESKTAVRFAELHERNGDSEAAALARAAASQAALVEQRLLGAFDSVFLCTSGDAAELAAKYSCRAVAVPNVIRTPEAPPPPAPVRAELTLLFVGVLNYFPNEDGILFFVRELLPEIRRRAGLPVRVLVVGASPSPRMREISGVEGVSVIGEVADVAPYYAEADAVIVPLRTGGGTRIKVLEGFRFRRPVISTRAGAEGHEVSHGVELLLAETPGEWADACRLLVEQRAFAAEMADRAFAWVKVHCNLEAATRPLAAAYGLAAKAGAGSNTNATESS